MIKTKLCLYKSPDIVCVSETHLHACDDLNVEGYKFYSRPRQSRYGSGGVGMLVKDSVFQKYTVSVVSDDVDGILAVNFGHLVTGSLSTIVSNYLPPTGSSYGKDSEQFFDKLLMISYEQSESEMVLFCGDFNARIGNLSDAPCAAAPPRDSIDKTVNSHGQSLLSFLGDNGCCVLNGR